MKQRSSVYCRFVWHYIHSESQRLRRGLTLLCLLQEALDIVHVSKEDQESVFAMISAVLWLGNVSFTVIDNENHVEAVADESKILLVAWNFF